MTRFRFMPGLLTISSLMMIQIQAQSVQAPNPVVTTVEVFFHTNDDDKDGDTWVTTDFVCGTGQVFASRKDTYGHFDDNSEHGWYFVPVSVHVQKVQLPTCRTKIRIDPNGKDTWKFNYWIKIHYSDSSMTECHYDGHWLSQDNRENWFTLCS